MRQPAVASRRPSMITRAFVFRVALCLLVAVSAFKGVASAQMPDPKQMSGIPRPVSDLPNGTVSVRLIKGELTNNLAGHPVELHIGGEVKVVNTDAEGRAQFDKLPAGATLKAVAVVDGERLESQEFPAPSEGAIRLMLVATDKELDARKKAEAEAAAVSGTLAISGDSRIVIEPDDESLSIFYILDIMNNAQAPMNPTVPFVFSMPDGVVRTTLVQGSSPLAAVNGNTVSVNGPFPPGRTVVEVAASYPVTSSSFELTQTFPALFEQPLFIVKKEGAMSVSSKTFTRQQETAVEGTPVIIGAAQPVQAGQPIALTIAGLSYHSSTPRLTALSLAGLILAVGGWFAVKGGEPRERGQERQHLVARREKLLQELTRLEQDQRRGKVDAARFTGRREDLVRSLEAVYATLDQEDGDSTFHAAGGVMSRPGNA